MEKKRYLKEGFEITLIFIQLFLIIILGSEVDDLTIFIISKLLLSGLFYINHKILINYGYIINEVFNI